MMKSLKLKEKLGRILSPIKHRRIYKDYLVPIMHIRSKQQPYNAKEFFELFWKSNEGFEDRHSISTTQSELHSKFHYNLVENNIIEFLVDHDYDVADLDVLDIGSGTGHWLRFWEDLSANSVTGIEISETAFKKLQTKFKGHENIRIILGDISSDTFHLDRKFDVINAIGVMFHVTDDKLWERAIKNLCNHLKGGGIAFVGGDFGLLTRNVQFHMTDNFETWDELNAKKVGGQSRSLLVNKRLRSKRYWERVIKENNCKILKIKGAKVPNNIHTPQNNLLIFKKVV